LEYNGNNVEVKGKEIQAKSMKIEFKHHAGNHVKNKGREENVNWLLISS